MTIDELFEKLSGVTICIDNEDDAYRFLGLLKRLEDAVVCHLLECEEDEDE